MINSCQLCPLPVRPTLTECEVSAASPDNCCPCNQSPLVLTSIPFPVTLQVGHKIPLALTRSEFVMSKSLEILPVECVLWGVILPVEFVSLGNSTNVMCFVVLSLPMEWVSWLLPVVREFISTHESKYIQTDRYRGNYSISLLNTEPYTVGHGTGGTAGIRKWQTHLRLAQCHTSEWHSAPLWRITAITWVGYRWFRCFNCLLWVSRCTRSNWEGKPKLSIQSPKRKLFFENQWVLMFLALTCC